MIRIKIDRKKVDRNACYIGKSGEYYDFTLMDNRDGVDQYGNDGFVVQDLGKERRLAGEKGPIIGNWQHVETQGRDRTASEGRGQPQGQQRDNGAGNGPDDSDDIPFNKLLTPFQP